MDNPLIVLRKYWHHQQFRPQQEEIIASVLNGNDTLALLPTGGGKSVCFQVPALMKEGVCVVVTPLIALMQDQVSQLQKKGIHAVTVHSGLSRREVDILLDNCVYGSVRFLYVSPERLQTELFQERFKRMNCSLIAVDEAHCISQWGYDFRPAYLKIATIREFHPNAPVIALTATADDRVQEDIVTRLNFRKPAGIFKRSFARDNLSFVMRRCMNKQGMVSEILRKVPGAAIVYVRSRKAAQLMAGDLGRMGVSASFYHAGLPAEKRSQYQSDWISDKCRVIVATNAFGMGIDKSDVRVVIHTDIPENMETYYQEAGRAGRDGKRSYAVVLYNEVDLSEAENKIEQAYPDLPYIARTYQGLANYYQLAEGAGEGESFDFDIQDFSSRFEFQPVEVFHAIKKLEESGLLVMNESFYSPTRIYIPGGHEKLYTFQVANEKFDPVIKAILRIYGGEVFSSFVSISEGVVSKAAGVPLAETKRLLRQLGEMEVILLSPAKDQPQITFVIPRQDSTRLPLDRKWIESRRKLMLGKIRKMNDFVTETGICRMRGIQEYFGEHVLVDCGICDICIGRRRKENHEELKRLREAIVRVLQKEEISMEILEEKVAPPHANLFIDAVRELLDEDEIAYDEIWNLKIKSGL